MDAIPPMRRDPDLRCPRCGSPMYRAVDLVWCSFVGDGRSSSSCRYGIDSTKTVADVEREGKAS